MGANREIAPFLSLSVGGGLYHGVNESHAKSGATTFESRTLAGVL